MERFIVSASANPNAAGSRKGGDRVFNGVFQDRLQKERGDLSLQCVRGDVELDRKSIGKADLLEIQVPAAKFELIVKCCFGGVRAIQRHSQQFA